MAAQNTLTIRFKAEGKDELKAAFSALSTTTNKLAKSQEKLKQALAKVKKETKGAKDSVDKTNKSWVHHFRNMEGGGDTLSKIGRKMSMLRSRLLIVAFAVGLVSKAVKEMNDAFVGFEKLNRKIEAVLRATNHAAGLTASSLSAMAAEFEKSLGFSAEQIKEMQVRLLTFTSIIGDNFERASKMAINLSAAFGQDLTQSAIQLGKALQEPTVGLGALRRVGVSFTVSQKELITELEKSGRIFEAQTEILRIMESQVGETAKASVEAAAGTEQFRQVGIELHEIMVDLGAILQVVLLPLGFFIKLIAQAVNDALDLARAISVDLYPNLMNLKFFLETGMWKDFADGLKDTEENLKNMNGELADIMKQGVSLDELFKAGLFDPKLMKGMLEEIKEFGDGPIGDELMASLAAMIGQNITLVGQFIKKLRDEADAVEKSEKALSVKLAVLKATTAEEKHLAQATHTVSQEEIDLVNAIEKEIKVQAAVKANIGKTKEEKLEAAKASLALLEAELLLTGGTKELEQAIKNLKAQLATAEFEKFEAVFNEISRMAGEFNEIFKELVAEVRAEAQALIDANNEVYDEQIAAVRNHANAVIAEEKKTRRWQRMTAAQQAAWEQDKLQEVVDFETQKNAERKAENDKIKAEANKDIIKQFKFQQGIDIAAAIMNTAQSIMKVTAQTGIFAAPWIAAYVALGAAQVAMISSQKPPTMAQGGLVGGKLHSQGGTLIEAERGEFVMSRSAVDSIGTETLNRLNQGGATSNIVINFSGNVLSDDYIEDEAIPKIKEALRRGGDIGVG